MTSLLDTADKWVSTWWLVFRNLPPEGKRSRFWKLLEPGFEHVELWHYDRGIWIRIEPCFELVGVGAHASAPWDVVPEELKPTILRVERLVPKHKMREPFFVGPWTCVELAKAFVGVRAPFVRTPYQLYKFLRKKNG